jgi:hypothetical protein
MSAPFTITDFIAQQLKAAAPTADWNAAGVDRAQELASFFVRAGIYDLSKISIVPKHVTVNQISYSDTVGGDVGQQVTVYTWDFKGLSDPTSKYVSLTPNAYGDQADVVFLQMVYNGKTYGFLGDTNGPASTIESTFLQKTRIAFSAAGHGHVDYYATADASGHLIFVPIWGSSSDLSFFHDALKGAATWAAIVFPVVGIAAGATLGSYILGPTLSAQYPALATAVGNTAIGTAMNGGNVAAAVKSAALGAAGGAAGVAVGGAAVNSTGSTLLGKVAASATAAFVQGGDVKTAVTSALLANGYQSMDAAFNVDTSALDALGTGAGTDAFGNPLTVPSDYGLTSQVSLTAPYADTSLSPIFDPALSYQLTSGLVPSSSANLVAPPADTSSPLVTPNQSAGSFDLSTVIKNVSQAGMAALQLVAAYNKVSGTTGVNTTARYVSPNGTTITATDSGLIQTQNPNGSVTSTIPPKGQPQVTIGGNIVVNNGDGTYTLIDPNGNRTINQYASTPAGSAALASQGGTFAAMLKNPAIIAAGIGAIVAFTRR